MSHWQKSDVVHGLLPRGRNRMESGRWEILLGIPAFVASHTRNCDKLPESSQRAPRELPEPERLFAEVVCNNLINKYASKRPFQLQLQIPNLQSKTPLSNCGGGSGSALQQICNNKRTFPFCNNMSFSSGSGSALQICSNKQTFPFWNNMSFCSGSGSVLQQICSSNKRNFPFWNNMYYSTYIGIQYKQKNRSNFKSLISNQRLH